MAFHFDLVDDSGYYKEYRLDAYQIRQFRGEGIRTIIEHLAEELAQDLCGKIVEIHLTFT